MKKIARFIAVAFIGAAVFVAGVLKETFDYD